MFGFTDPRLLAAKQTPGWAMPGPLAPVPLTPGFRAPGGGGGGMPMGGMPQMPQITPPQIPMMGPFAPREPRTTREGGSGGGMGVVEDEGLNQRVSNDDGGFWPFMKSLLPRGGGFSGGGLQGGWDYQ